MISFRYRAIRLFAPLNKRSCTRFGSFSISVLLVIFCFSPYQPYCGNKHCPIPYAGMIFIFFTTNRKGRETCLDPLLAFNSNVPLSINGLIFLARCKHESKCETFPLNCCSWFYHTKFKI